jgi:crossover junction endodeoxyribonuclease RuvC
LQRIIGIDPGSHRVGYAILDREDRTRKVKLIDYGTIEVESEIQSPESLLLVHSELKAILKKYKPEVASVEELFFFKNQKTVAQVYEARGVILFTLIERGLKILEPTITQIKKGVTGSGTADKKQVKEAIKLILGLKELKGHDDSWDAVAAAFVGLAMFR